MVNSEARQYQASFSEKALSEGVPESNASVFCGVCRWLAAPYQPLPPEDISEWEDDEEYAARMRERARQAPNCFQKFVFSNFFEVIVILAITGCTGLLGMEAACYKADPACTVEYEDVLRYAEDGFIGIFVLEWFFRLFTEGVEYFNSFEHLCDTFIIWVTGVLLQWAVPVLAPDEWKSTPEYAAVMSLRGLRTLRFISVMKHVKSFRTLVAGLMANAKPLGACIIMLLYLDWMFGIIAVEIIGGYEGWGQAPEGTNIHAFQKGLPSACMAFSRLVIHDGAITLIEDIVVKQPFIAIFCALYMTIASFLILNLVTAVIVEQAQMMAQESEDEKQMRIKQEEVDKFQDLKKTLRKLDKEASGKISMDDFHSLFREARTRNQLLSFGFTEQEMKMLFKILDTDNMSVLDIEELCHGLQKVKGEADSKSLLEAKNKAMAIEHALWRVAPPDVIRDDSEHASMREASIEDITGESLEDRMFILEDSTNARLNNIQMMIRNCGRAARGLEDKIRKKSKASL